MTRKIEQKVVIYGNLLHLTGPEHRFAKDSKKLAEEGWRVVSAPTSGRGNGKK